jgi:hypothetical protein
MSYDPNTISIRSTGEVVRGGNYVGRIEFPSIVARDEAVGEHIVEQYAVRADMFGDLEDKVIDLQNENDGLADELGELKIAARKALVELKLMALVERPDLKDLITDLEGLL